MKYNCALVLEGGGMRAAYTNGVLDYFITNDIDFNYVVSVSAGVGCAMNFIAKNKGRAQFLSTEYASDKRIMSATNLVSKGSYFDLNIIYNVLDKEVPFDYKTFYESSTELMVGCFNLKTGNVDYFNKEYIKKDNSVVIASSSLPLLSKVIKVNNTPYMDGGMRDSIPLNKAIEDGYQKQVIILTNPADYVRSKESSLFLMKMAYRKYPKLIEAMERRHTVYNEMIERINKLEAENKVFVIRPTIKLEVGRYTKDALTLTNAYNQGATDVAFMKDKLLEYLKED
ncbi:patatin family protein [Mycoplasma sp. P36-A1]|uniref:patatin family protein n=1 Tax=Mycoplasma sp. P36-A1 TaxID=3252900 RepID=UPI003C2EABF3